MKAELIQAIYTLIDRRLSQVTSLPIQLATVTDVDKDNSRCTVELATGAILEDVNLRSVLDGNQKGFVVYPALQSKVLIGTIANHEANACVLMYSEITDVRIDAKVVINEGSNKGMVKLPELVEKLNTLEQKVNQLLTWSSTHTHVGVTTGGGTSGAAIGVTGTITPTQEQDIENPDILH